MEKMMSQDLKLLEEDANKNKVQQKHHHLSFSQIQDHLHNETSGQQKHAIDGHILHCDRCRSIWNDLVHFNVKHKHRNILQSIEMGLRKLIATHGFTVLGLKALLVLIVFAISLRIITYDFGENRVTAFGKTKAAQMSKIIDDPEVRSVVPVIDLVKQDPINLSNAIQTTMLKYNEPTLESESKNIVVESEIKNARLPFAHTDSQTPTTHMPIKKKSATKAAPLKNSRDRNNDTKPIAPKATFRTISGTVISEKGGTPLAGVKVTVPGLAVSVFTDQEGEYRIGVPTKRTHLVFDYKSAQVFQPLDSTNQLVNVSMPMLKSVNKKILDISPYPITSESYYKTYLKHNLKYPARALRNKIAGTVIVAFTVEADGNLANLRVSQSLGYGCDKEAIRLVTEGPDWHPALVNGEPVAKEAILLVSFQQ